MNSLEFHRLVLQVLVILAIFQRNSQHFLRRLRGQFAVGRRVGQLDLLSRIDADLPLQQDQVFLQLVLRPNQGLLLRLQLHPRPQLVEIGRGSSLVRLVRVIQLHLRLGHLRLRVLHIAPVRNGAQINRGHLLHHLAPRRHLRKISGPLRCSRRFPPGNHRA